MVVRPGGCGLPEINNKRFRMISVLKINISKLTEGLHEFSQVIEPDACGLEANPVFVEPIQVTIRLQKFGQSYLADLHIKTMGHFQCDRCLEPFRSEVTATDRIVFSTAASTQLTSIRDLRIVSPQTFELDFTEDVRETLVLAPPTKILCSDSCAGLCPGCGVNLNSESCQCQHAGGDPRWVALEKLRLPSRS